MKELTEYTQKGYWEITTAPIEKKNRIELQDLKKILEKSQVRHRGWPFPFMRSEDESILSTCYQSITIGDKVPKYEGFRFYESGLFYWKAAMWENAEAGYGEKTLSYISANWQITEMLLFIKRIYEETLSPEDRIHLELRLGGCQGRYLVGDHGERAVYTNCAEETITIEDNFNCAQIKASWQEFARKYIKRVYAIFGASETSDDSILEKQNKLLKMKMI